MTIRKRDIILPPRTPAYVSREIGAAELCISPDTWDNWVAAGKLPKPAAGFPESSPRWRWTDLDTYLSGGQKEIDSPSEDMSAPVRTIVSIEPFFRKVPRHGKGTPSHKRGKSTAARLQGH